MVSRSRCPTVSNLRRSDRAEAVVEPGGVAVPRRGLPLDERAAELSCSREDPLDWFSPDSSCHLLYAASEARQVESSSVGAVAMRTGTINDEHLVGSIPGEVALIDLSVRQTDRPWEMSGGVELWASYVEQNKIRLPG